MELNEVEAAPDSKVDNSKEKVYTRLNYFGLFLLATSIIVTFAPAMFPSLAPNGWEVIAWVGWGLAIFILAMIVFLITNLFKFFSKNNHEENDSSTGTSWLTIIKVPLLIGLIVFALTFFS